MYQVEVVQKKKARPEKSWPLLTYEKHLFKYRLVIL